MAMEANVKIVNLNPKTKMMKGVNNGPNTFPSM
jgi:hypothetical protein